MTEDNTYTVTVSEDKSGERLDRFLADALSDFSRNRLKALIEDGQVVLQNVPVTSPKTKVKTGDVFQIIIPPPVAANPEPQDIPLDIIYEDDDLLVLDKPVGMVVHPAAGNYDGTLVNALLHHCRGSLSGVGGVARPGIVHRLDKGTSGLMLVAKNDQAHIHLSHQFAEHSLERAYKAVVWGVPSPASGELDGNIGRSQANRKKMTVLKHGGKTALTRYRVIEQYGLLASLVECRLATGRTHQIRVHMADLGHPVMGDKTYGRDGRKLRRELPNEVLQAIEAVNNQLLYAYIIGFIHPRTKERMFFESTKSLEINKICELFKKI